ncbi:glycosyltransferase family 2 protein [uncultured Solobacterium sp.]|uniref:glycosyltransferase family 2 protein n=1 Tax=uncultured Solobacterium sp. TaxID=747375 RepID=UPI0028D1C930|nr:glycosyltransferase family 2 protein [uncultured Solobacterium sp.]
MNTPIVSIIVPVYNAAKPLDRDKTVLHRCIDSILNQEYRDYELIIVDDGSKDESGKILDEYAAKDSRIKVIHKENSGVSNTRNLAIQNARGKYIQFLDADDWITTDATKSLVRTMEESKADLVIADFYRVVGENTSHKGRIDSDKVLTRDEFADYMIQNPADYYYGVLWNKLYKKSIIDAYHLKMDASLSWSEDFIFNLEYLLHVKHVAPLQLPIYYYVKTEGSLVSQSRFDIRNIVDMKLSVIKYYDNFYKSIYDEKEYTRKRPEIMSFLVGFATDDSAISFSTKKLGEEIVPVAKLSDHKQDAILHNYYTTKLLERLLQRISTETGLSPNELIVIHYLNCFPHSNVTKDMSLFTDVNQLLLVPLLEKLVFNEYVTREKSSDFETYYSLSQKAESITKQLNQLTQDFDSIRFAGIDPSTQELLQTTEETIYENIRKKLL